jgi:hypothetical protein
MEVSGQIHGPAALPPGSRAADTHWMGGWVGPRVGLDTVAKRKSYITPTGIWTPVVQPIASSLSCPDSYHGNEQAATRQGAVSMTHFQTFQRKESREGSRRSAGVSITLMADVLQTSDSIPLDTWPSLWTP